MAEQVQATYGPMTELASQLRSDPVGQSPMPAAADTGHAGLDQALSGFENCANSCCGAIDDSFAGIAEGVEHEISNFSKADSQ